MAAITYTKGDRKAEVDIRELSDGKFQGVVLLLSQGSGVYQPLHLVPAFNDTPEEALEAAKALAHRLLGEA